VGEPLVLIRCPAVALDLDLPGREQAAQGGIELLPVKAAAFLGEHGRA
jgi:hypothetical protein